MHYKLSKISLPCHGQIRLVLEACFDNGKVHVHRKAISCTYKINKDITTSISWSNQFYSNCMFWQ